MLLYKTNKQKNKHQTNKQKTIILVFLQCPFQQIGFLPPTSQPPPHVCKTNYGLQYVQNLKNADSLDPRQLAPGVSQTPETPKPPSSPAPVAPSPAPSAAPSAAPGHRRAASLWAEAPGSGRPRSGGGRRSLTRQRSSEAPAIRAIRAIRARKMFGGAEGAGGG